MIFVKQTDMPESCSDCGMLQFHESDYCGDSHDCKALEFLGKESDVCNRTHLSEELRKRRSPKCPLRILPFNCLEMLGGIK